MLGLPEAEYPGLSLKERIDNYDAEADRRIAELLERDRAEVIRMEIKLRKRTPEESREYLMLQIATLINDRRELLETSKKVAKWLEHYTEIWFSSEDDIENESFRDVSEAWYKCIERLSS